MRSSGSDTAPPSRLTNPIFTVEPSPGATIAAVASVASVSDGEVPVVASGAELGGVVAAVAGGEDTAAGVVSFALSSDPQLAAISDRAVNPVTTHRFLAVWRMLVQSPS